MNYKKTTIWRMVLLAGGILAFLIPVVLAAHAEMEDVKVLERKPDESNPQYEIIKVEGGLIFRAPKDMTFIKQDGVIAPISTEEYCLRKFGGVEQQIKALSQRIKVLEENAAIAPGKKNKKSL